MAKKSSITDIIAGAGNYVVTVRETRASGCEITHRELYHPTPSSLRRVLRAIAQMAGVEDIEAELYEAHMQEFMRQNKELVETRKQLEEAQKQLKAWGNAFAFWQNDDDAVWDGDTTASGTNRIAQAEEAERKARTK